MKTNKSRTTEAVVFLREYDQFFNKIANSLKRKCPRLEIEDIKQQMSLAVLIGCDKFKEEKTAEFSTYCCTIAINCAATILKKYYQGKNRINIDCVSLDEYLASDKQGKTYSDVVKEDEHDISYPDSFYEYNESRRVIDEVSANLPPFEKKVFDYFIAGYDIPYIARKMKRSDKTIYSTIKRIRDKFKLEI